MRVSKYTLPAIVISLISLVLVGTKPAHAMSSALECSSPNGYTSFACDLAIDKQVSVGSSAFTEAQTAATAVSAQVGDTVTWKVTISNDSAPNEYPLGELTVKDILPSGVTFVSYTTTEGTYANGNWTFNLAGKAQPVLTIITTANTTGLIENTAAMSTYVSPCNQQQVPFSDFNGNNNVANAFINIPVPTPTPATTTTPSTPATTPTTTTVKAPNTGFNVKDANVTYTMLSYGLLTIILAAAGFKLRALGKI